MSKHEISTHAGKISAKTAELKAKDEYKKDYIKALKDMEMKLLGDGKEK